jgi:hypothetical protein
LRGQKPVAPTNDLAFIARLFSTGKYLFSVNYAWYAGCDIGERSIAQN